MLRPRAASLMHSPIGIDLGSRVLRAVQLDGAGRVRSSLALQRAAPDQPLTLDEVWSLASALERRGFVGRAVCASMPKRSTRQAMIELPPEDSGAPLAEIARAQLARLHDWAEDAFELTWWTPAGSNPPARGRVIAVCCPHDESNALLDMLESGGLDVRALAPGPAAIARAIDVGAEPGMVVDLGWSSAEVLVVSEGRVLFQRSLARAAFAATHAACASALGAGDDAVAWLLGPGRESTQSTAAAITRPLREFGELLASELAATRAYAAQCWPRAAFDHLWLAGGGSRDPELAEWLEASLGVMCQPCHAAPGLGGEFTAACGLATTPAVEVEAAA